MKGLEKIDVTHCGIGDDKLSHVTHGHALCQMLTLQWQSRAVLDLS